ncbi:MAG TPA: MarR family transcriptional regulator [Acidothermaceae bacterium]|jgi:DNA-binding MarR family transcriptional regulator|nr:MarR family transcriptional regulator [Acidothermaceae bacterium]
MDDIEALAAAVIRLARHLELARRETLAARELEVWEYDVLLALRTTDAKAGLSPGALVGATQVASGTMTNRIDRLARRGLVTREPDPGDRRGVLVRLTPTGRRRVDQARGDVRKAEARMFDALGSRKRQQLNAATAEALGVFEGA